MNFNINKVLYFIIAFITFIGFYSVLTLVLYSGYSDQTRLFTVPLRIIALVCMLLYVLINRFRPCNYIDVYYLYFTFIIIYTINVLIEILSGYDSFLFRPPIEILLYLIVYSIFPFLFFSQEKKRKHYDIIFISIISSGVILSILSFLLYGEILLAGYTRISAAIGNYDFALLSPLSLSYSGALLIGIATSKLLFTPNVKNKLLLYTSIVVGLIPFFLGASRGSVLALIIPFLFVLLIRRNKKELIYTSIISVFIIPFLILLAENLGSGVFARLFALQTDIEAGASSTIRLVRWELNVEQILSAPILGDSIYSVMPPYPHNVLIEVLMATGILGFIPYITLIIISIKKSLNIIKYRDDLIWIVILYWLGFIESMFSGAVYSVILFWGGLGLLFSVNHRNIN